MRERITPYLQVLIKHGSTAVERQFKATHDDQMIQHREDDPLGEEVCYSPCKGLVHKYANRVLWKVSYRCAAHCQFCTRVRQIGSKEGDLQDEDIERGFKYLTEHPEVDDVILSGGDPLYTPNQTLHILDGLMGIASVRVIRIGTRLPVHSPQSVTSAPMHRLLERIEEFVAEKPIYILINFNHPDELGEKVVETIKLLRRSGAILLAQTVFLKNINDDAETLAQLFRTLYHLGVIPYYIYRCDYVKGVERFVCDLEAECAIMTQLRRTLSGIAIPTYVVDVAGKGKLPVPLQFWAVADIHTCQDFDGKTIIL